MLSIVDGAGIPIPEGVDFLLFYIAYQDTAAGYLTAGLSVIGSLAGTMILFYIGRAGGHKLLESKSQTARARKFRQWFHHYGMLTVFVPALIPAPLPLKIFVLSAGALDANPVHFALVVLGARIPRYFGEAYVATQVRIDPATFFKQHTWQFLGIAVGLFLVLFLIVKVKDRIRELEHRRHNGTM